MAETVLDPKQPESKIELRNPSDYFFTLAHCQQELVLCITCDHLAALAHLNGAKVELATQHCHLSEGGLHHATG